MSKGVFRIFLRGWHQTLTFLSVVFFGIVNLKLIEEQNNGSRESEGMLLQKMFENLDTVMAILVLYQQFLRQILFQFLPLTPNPSLNMTHFVCTFSILHAQGARTIALKKV